MRAQYKALSLLLSCLPATALAVSNLSPLEARSAVDILTNGSMSQAINTPNWPSPGSQVMLRAGEDLIVTTSTPFMIERPVYRFSNITLAPGAQLTTSQEGLHIIHTTAMTTHDDATIHIPESAKLIIYVDTPPELNNVQYHVKGQLQIYHGGNRLVVDK